MPPVIFDPTMFVPSQQYDMTLSLTFIMYQSFKDGCFFVIIAILYNILQYFLVILKHHIEERFQSSSIIIYNNTHMNIEAIKFMSVSLYQ